MNDNNNTTHATSFKILGIEFTGPAWMALIFIAFCIIVLFYFIQSVGENSEVIMGKATTQPNQQSVENPCNVPWQQQPNSCPD